MSQPTEPRQRRPLIWITDDSAVEAKYTENALGPDYDYEHFADGSLVVERLAAADRQPDVLLLDWVMPTMSGDEVCRFLRSRPQTAELPIIIVTASRLETKDVVEGLSIGANDYVARPFVPEELRARVETVIRAKRMRERAARERARLAAIGRLGRAFVEAGPRVEAVLEALATTLVTALCDGCAVTMLAPAHRTVARHRASGDATALAGLGALADPCVHEFANSAEALAKMPPAYHPVIRRFGMSGLAVMPLRGSNEVTGIITVTRDGHSVPFEPDDLATIETCIEYAAIAIENAQRFDAERTARAQLHAILQNLPVGVMVVEPDGAIQLANPAASRLLPSLATTRSYDTVVANVEARTLAGTPAGPDTPVRRALRGEHASGIELEVAGAASPVFLRATAAPLRGERGEILAAISVFEDVTSERAAAVERERALEFQQYVLGIVGHDLRNPLAAIHMGCEVLRKRATEVPEIVPIAERLQASSTRMQRIVDQLLDVARARLGGGFPVERTETDLQRVVTSVIDELALAYPEATFEPKLEAVHGTWDADRLAQVVSNLIGNAIQHGAAESPVWIEAASEGDDALIRVRNLTTGAPISKEQEKTIFEPFHGSSQGSRTGLGLGLYIANEIMRAHRGHISIESNAETTTFTVRLPRRRLRE